MAAELAVIAARIRLRLAEDTADPGCIAAAQRRLDGLRHAAEGRHTLPISRTRLPAASWPSISGLSCALWLCGHRSNAGRCPGGGEGRRGRAAGLGGHVRAPAGGLCRLPPPRRRRAAFRSRPVDCFVQRFECRRKVACPRTTRPRTPHRPRPRPVLLLLHHGPCTKHGLRSNTMALITPDCGLSAAVGAAAARPGCRGGRPCLCPQLDAPAAGPGRQRRRELAPGGGRRGPKGRRLCARPACRRLPTCRRERRRRV